ncbi:TIM barrel protein [bacterium]|nr:TIM barrel protein [bacterium]
MNLDGLEVEFVHGVRMTEANQELVREYTKQNNMILTCHGPYYINLNSQEPEKIEASIQRIIETARMGKAIGAYSITFHAAFYMKQEPDEVYKTVYKSMETICSTLEKEDNDIYIRPETTGKGTQWGTLEEIVQLSKEFKYVLPCIDFAHVHARNNGIYNTYDEFCRMLEYTGNELGVDVFNNFHAHLAGIEYSVKGEKNHLILQESDMNYKDLLKAFKKFDVKGALVCESPNIEDDAKLLKEYYLSL